MKAKLLTALFPTQTKWVLLYGFSFLYGLIAELDNLSGLSNHNDSVLTGIMNKLRNKPQIASMQVMEAVKNREEMHGKTVPFQKAFHKNIHT